MSARRRGLSPYARLFRIPGVKAFCLSAALARLPMSMMSLGIVLALNHLYDNWTIAGMMSAVYVFAVAVVTPLYARLFDRFGQRRVGCLTLTVQVGVMLLFAFGALLRVPIAVLFVLAVMMGFTQFSFGALVRTRWAYALRGVDGAEPLLNAAYALEAAIDEIVFILGPILAAWLATSVHPVSQLFVPTVACALGGGVFFRLKSTQPPAMVERVDVGRGRESMMGEGERLDRSNRFSLRLLRAGGPRPKSALLYGGVLPVLAVFVVFNMSFTAFDVSITAAIKAMGLECFLGVQLAMFAVGSCIGAVIFGSRRFRGSHWGHMVLFLCALSVGYVGFRLAMDDLLLLGALEVATGLFVSPLFTTGNLVVKDIVPAESLTEGLSWVSTAGTVGASLGSLVAGIVLDHAGAQVGMVLPFCFTVCALPIALLGWSLARRHD